MKHAHVAVQFPQFRANPWRPGMTQDSAEAGPIAAPGGRHLRPAVLSLALSSVLLIALVMVSGLTPEGIWKAIRLLPVWAYVPIAAAQSVIILLGAVKWWLILRETGGGTVGLRDASAATAIGALAGQVMPIQLVTPAARAWIARRHRIPLGRALGTSLMEQAFEVIVLATMALIGAVLVLGGVAPFLGGAAVAAGAGLLLLLSSRLALVPSALSEHEAGGLKSVLSKVVRGVADAARLSRKLFVQLTGLSLMRYVLLAGLNVTLLSVLVPEASPVTLFAAYPLVLFLMSLPFFPGGLGVVELTWASVLMANGETATAAAEAAIALRIVSTFGFVLIAPALIALRDHLPEEAA